MFSRLVTACVLRHNVKEIFNSLSHTSRCCHHFTNLTIYERNSKIFCHEKIKAFSTHPTEKMEIPIENVSKIDNNHPIKETLSNEKLFEEIAQGDPEIIKKLKLFEFEIAILKEEQFTVPDQLLKKDWMKLLELNSINKRKKYLTFLRLNEIKSLKKKSKSQKKIENLLKEKKEMGFHYYGLGGHTMFLRIYRRDLNFLLQIRQKVANFCLIYDCSYQEYMNTLNTKACAKQLLFCVNDSKIHPYPCRLEFFNVDRNEELGKTIPLYIQKFYEGSVGEIHSGSYLEKYPKEKLVYLTPDATQTLTNFSTDDIYIIGAFVDKGTGEKASLAKAKEHGLRMAKLPIDQYVQWKKGVKALPLNVITIILLDMALYNDWKKAFKNLSKRNLDYICFKMLKSNCI